MYQLIKTALNYGSKQFLAHLIKGKTEFDDRYLFGQRVPSYGIINFGEMKAYSTKSFKPIEHGITSPIQIVSIYAFTISATADECTLKLFDSNNDPIGVQRLTNNDIPYSFPPGAIINPDLTLQVSPKYNATQVLINWQSVDVLSYVEVK